MPTTTFETFISAHKIEIPAIQRDYVQGREDIEEYRDKREAFADKLIDTISGQRSACHLEFVYGAEDKTSHGFIPLDGQQRLTTLYLLHWVVWQLNPQEVRKLYPIDDLRGFTYKTRISSSNFCENLTGRCLLPVKNCNGLKEQIKRQPWFSGEWNYDPTVVAMLSMIDCLEKRLANRPAEELERFLENLSDKSRNNITFDELNMSEYNLTDSLYIKMNARGKQLTQFENWKAEFIKHLGKNFPNEPYEDAEADRKKHFSRYKDYFSFSIEHQWTDLFWSYLKEEYLLLDAEQQQKQYPVIDKMFMNLLDVFCEYFYYVRAKGENKADDKADYERISGEKKRAIYYEKPFIDFLLASLDSLCRINHATFFGDLFYVSDKEMPASCADRKVRLFRSADINLFRTCAQRGVGAELIDKLMFIALLKYCNLHHVESVDTDIKAYIRKVRNYLENDIQRLNTRTTVQLNLRANNADKYDNAFNKILTGDYNESPLSENRCRIEDCSLTYSNVDAFREAADLYGEDAVASALSEFCLQTDLIRVRLLISCGYEGAYLGDCIGRQRRFFGSKEKWNVVFVSDGANSGRAFAKYVSLLMDGKTHADIIREALACHYADFAYYMLKYDSFAEANNAMHHFAVRGNLDDVDLIALGSYSSNPGTAYHIDPLCAAVEECLTRINPSIKLALYKQYSGKAHISIIRDKISWEVLFSMVSRPDGWHIAVGKQYVSNALRSKHAVDDSSEGEWIVPKRNDTDMVEQCTNILQDVFNEIKSVTL